MKKLIRRFFGLDDDQLKGKKAKLYGWFCTFFGCACMITAIILCLYVEPIVDDIEYKYARCIKHIKLDAELPQHNTNILRAIRMLDPTPVIPKDTMYCLVGLVFVFGFLFINQGLLYFKIHSLLNKNTSTEQAPESSSQHPIHSSTTENNTMSNPDTTSIATSLRKLILILAVPSIVFSVFLIFLMGFIIYTYRSAEQSYEDSRTVEVVVAKTNIVAGAVLGYDNLGVKRFTQSKLQTKDYIIEDHAYVVMGYRVKKPLEINEPLTWHNTDIVITNKVGR
jgi:SAF domain